MIGSIVHLVIALAAGFLAGVVLDEFFGRGARAELKKLEARLAELERALKTALAKV